MVKIWYPLGGNGGVPSDMVTSDISGLRRLKVDSATTAERQMVVGQYFGAYTERLSVGVGDTTYFVIKANDKWLTIRDILSIFNFSTITDGLYSYQLRCYFSNSNINDWTYSGGVEVPLGRPLTSLFINNAPSATVETGGTLDNISGSFDHQLRFTEYYIDTQGNRESITETDDTFFLSQRKIILAPGDELLIESITDGNANGSADIITKVFVSEVETLEELQ